MIRCKKMKAISKFTVFVSSCIFCLYFNKLVSAFPGGCDLSSVSSKEWKLARPLYVSKLVFPDNALDTKKRHFWKAIYPLKTIQDEQNFSDLNLADIECGAENENGINGKIVGGQETKEHQFPWMVATEIDGFIFCGASLISKIFEKAASQFYNDMIN